MATSSSDTTGEQLANRDPDVRLMLQVRDDVPGAFEQLVERYQQRLLAVMVHALGNLDEAEDLAQEVFLRVYRSRKGYRPKAKLSTWLFTIANNLALNALRARVRRQTKRLPVRDDSGPLGSQHTEQMIRAPGSGPTTKLDQKELVQVIRQAIDELDERQRIAVVLNKFEDMSYAEVAEVMGLSPEAVKSLLSRARAKLRESLDPYIHLGRTSPERPH